MKKNCLDIGIIQAFLDGEMAQDQTASVSGHIATCDSCALMLADAEDESAIVFSALEREFNTLVPTQRLWHKINDSIAVERDRRPFWEKAWAFLSVGLLTPSMAAAASLIFVIGLAAVVWINQGRKPDIVAYIPTVSTPVGPLSIDPIVTPPDAKVASTITPVSRSVGQAEKIDYRPNVRRNERPDVKPTVTPSNTNSYMPGEESYVKTIASLSRSIGGSKDSVMRPSERISFERDLAVVDDAIVKMRTEVKRNPKNVSARQVLYSSYQNKIDLLNSVSQKEELVASLK